MQQISTSNTIAHREVVMVGNRKYQVFFKVLTICVVTDEDGRDIGMGSTQWSPQDQFDYDTGKKLALRNALREASCSFRTEFWKEFLERNRKRLHDQIKTNAQMVKHFGQRIRSVSNSVFEDTKLLKRGVYGCRKR